MLPVINMLSSAEKVKGQGVGSAFREQVDLVTDALKDKYVVVINKLKYAEIMHYHTIDPRFFLSLPIAKWRGKTVGYVHFLPETVDSSLRMPKFARAAFYWYMIRFYKSMDALVAVNPYFIEKLKGYGIPREKVTYIPNFVSEKTFFKVSEEERQDLRKKYNIAQNAFVVFGVGQLQTRKGIVDFIKIAQDMPQITFVWAGGFSFKQMTAGYEEIKKIVGNPPANVKFLGIVDRSEMNGLYNLCDVMFLPSFEELFPMAILESMNCYKPILLRDLVLYENILFDFYLKADGVDTFEKLLIKLKNDPDFYAQASEMSKRGHVFYSREHVAGMWEEFYDNILKK